MFGKLKRRALAAEAELQIVVAQRDRLEGESRSVRRTAELQAETQTALTAQAHKLNVLRAEIVADARGAVALQVLDLLRTGIATDETLASKRRLDAIQSLQNVSAYQPYGYIGVGGSTFLGGLGMFTGTKS